MTTAVAVLVFFAALVLGLITWAVCLHFGLRFVSAWPQSWLRLGVVASLFAVAGIASTALFSFIPQPKSTGLALPLLAAEFSVSTLVAWLIIKVAFSISMRKAALAWLPTLISSAVGFGLAMCVVRPYLFEAFVMPANSMAPTLLGKHITGTCTQCQSTCYSHTSTPGVRQSKSKEAICEKFHVTQLPNTGLVEGTEDKFLVAKFLRPRRWDLIVFRSPENPAVLYAKRLVGLPGEKVHIAEGTVWINGRRTDPPSNLAGLRYVTEIDNFPMQASGTLENPAVLAEDEYFVLGDFTTASLDSRFWQRGAPGHNVFAVPADYAQGVVSHIYWPPARWRVLR